MPIKSFRGLLGSGGQERLNLKHRDGRIGYKIVKFQIMPHAPGDNNDQEHIVTIWKVQRTTTQLGDTTTTRPNFSNDELLGVAFAVNDISSALNYSDGVIFDNEIFNQDIYVVLRDIGGATQSCNYYIELEQMKIASDEATVATLKNMRTTATQTAG